MLRARWTRTGSPPSLSGMGAQDCFVHMGARMPMEKCQGLQGQSTCGARLNTRWLPGTICQRLPGRGPRLQPSRGTHLHLHHAHSGGRGQLSLTTSAPHFLPAVLTLNEKLRIWLLKSLTYRKTRELPSVQMTAKQSALRGVSAVTCQGLQTEAVLARNEMHEEQGVRKQGAPWGFHPPVSTEHL